MFLQACEVIVLPDIFVFALGLCQLKGLLSSKTRRSFWSPFVTEAKNVNVVFV